MAFRLLVAKKINGVIRAIVIPILVLTGCTASDITIDPNDISPPGLTVSADQPGGQNIQVSAGGSGQTLMLTSKTGMLNVHAKALDSESGVQALEIWVNKTITSCDASGACSLRGPGLLGKPTFERSSPKLQPGDATSNESTLDQALDLAREIPQGSLAAGESRTVVLTIYGVAVNHLGGRIQTPELKAVWNEP